MTKTRSILNSILEHFDLSRDVDAMTYVKAKMKIFSEALKRFLMTKIFRWASFELILACVAPKFYLD